MSASGSMISIKRGRARTVKPQKVELDAPDSITSSRYFNDCVRKITTVSTTVTNRLAIRRFLKI